MSWIRTATGRNILLIGAAVALPFAVTALVGMTGVSLGRTVRLTIFVAILIPVFWLVTRYWRGLDEAAQEAQKSAWFWGGSLGMMAGLFVMLLLPLDFVAGLSGRGPQVVMAYGALFPTIGSLAGFVLAWALWWWRRR